MIVDSLKRGIIAGSVGGLVYGIDLVLIGSPLIEQLEHANHVHTNHNHTGMSELISIVINISSSLLWGVLLGAVFGVVYYLFEPSLPGTENVKVYVLAAAGFLTVSGVPWLALPPVAPGMEQTLTADIRLIIYSSMMVLGIIICAISIALFQYHYTQKNRGPIAAIAIAMTPFLLCVIPIFLIPTNIATPSDQLTTIYQLVVVSGQFLLWILIATIYTKLRGRINNEPAPSLDESSNEWKTDA